MEAVTLGFRAYDVHELACHFVARRQGLYRRHGLQVRLVDTNFIAESELPPRTLHTACGAALLAWLAGADMRVVFVAASRPMFWLYARPDMQQLADLDGKAVAGFPAPTPPAQFLRLILQQESIDPDRVVIEPARDDMARLGLLCDAAVSAAVVSSAIAPQRLEHRGFRELSFFGDELSIPTTGLAVDAATHAAEPGLVAAMSACYAEALGHIHDEPGVLEAALADCITAVDAEQEALADRVRRCYTQDGRVDPATLESGIGAMAAAVDAKNVREFHALYDFSAL